MSVVEKKILWFLLFGAVVLSMPATMCGLWWTANMLLREVSHAESGSLSMSVLIIGGHVVAALVAVVVWLNLVIVVGSRYWNAGPADEEEKRLAFRQQATARPTGAKQGHRMSSRDSGSEP